MPASLAPIGNRIAPARFLAFAVIVLVAVPLSIAWSGWAHGMMIGFDAAALVFLGSCMPLLRGGEAAAMRRIARENDANRAMLLVLATLAGAAVAAELAAPGRPSPTATGLIVVTLVLAWLFGNAVFALHYAHIYYLPGADGADRGGLDFPDAEEPDYADFAYFAATIGMTFQTSDVTIRTRALRRVVLAHALVAFIFNLGIVAFSVNVLGG